jgi:AraC-like DNA-binding protein
MEIIWLREIACNCGLSMFTHCILSHGGMHPIALFDAIAHHSSMAQLPHLALSAAHRVEQFLQKEYTRTWTLSTLASQFEISGIELKDAFRQHTGTDIPQYINRLRVARAAELLRPGVRIAEVAFAVGYNSSNSFVDAFEQIMGMLPSEYRNTRCENSSNESAA